MFTVPNITVERCCVNGTSYELITPDEGKKDILEYSPTGVMLMLNVRDFSPNEITCKVSKLLLEITAENDRIGRCGLFRKYVMPQNVNPQQCICQINKNGILGVAVPWENQSQSQMLPSPENFRNE